MGRSGGGAGTVVGAMADRPEPAADDPIVPEQPATGPTADAEQTPAGSAGPSGTTSARRRSLDGRTIAIAAVIGLPFVLTAPALSAPGWGAMAAICGLWTNAIDAWSLSFRKPCQAPCTPCIQYSATSSMPSTSVKNAIWRLMSPVEMAR